MNSEIIEYRNQKIRIMKEDCRELHHFVASDSRTADDYAGREIFELLQNAIDAGEKVKIELTNDTLIISNSGKPFKIDNIKALMMPDNSTKENSEDDAGYKGVGFRASLNISDDITIYSGKIHVHFSKKTAQEIKKKHGLREVPPIMMCPEVAKVTYRNDYTTNIILKIRNQEQIERIKKQISALNEESIIFLKDSFRSLEIVIDGEAHYFSRTRKIVSDNEVLITIYQDEAEYQLREFLEEGELEGKFENKRDKKYRLAIVYSPEPIERNKLYSFFRTDIDFPMQYWYAHGTFNLTNNRNQFVKNHRNDILMRKLIQLICNSAPKISNQIDYTAYKILRSHGSFSDTILEDVNLNEVLNDAINDAPILPTVHKKYISFNSEPVFYEDNFQNFLINMPDNEELLQYTDDNTVINYLNGDSTTTYTLETITEYLQTILHDFSNQERVEVASSLYDNYKNENDFLDLVPNFFLDEKGKEIDNGSILIRTSDADKLVLPKFIKLRYINREQLELAKKMLNLSNDEDFVSSDFAETYGIALADIEKILENIDELVHENAKLIPEYVHWLFDNRETITNTDHDKFYLLTKGGEIRRSDNIYFGKEYLKGTQLEKFYNSSKIVVGQATFKIKPDEYENFTSFLKNVLGVADRPRNKDGSIDGLKNILKSATTKYIIKLLISNQEYLQNHRYQSSAQEDFQTSKWITWRGRRYAPNEIILTSKQKYHTINDYIKDDFLFISQNEFLSGIDMEKSTEIWLIEEYLCFDTELYELDNKYIYKILNELPIFDLRGEISEDVYKDILNSNNKQPEPTTELPEFQKFLDSGKVFCLDKLYRKINDCLYLEKRYPKIIESEYHFVNITKGKSSIEIWNRLHIDKLSIDYQMHDFRKSKANTTDFQMDLDNFKVSLLVDKSDYFDSEKKINKLKDISIILCSSIDIEYDDKIGQLENYEFVNDESIFYVKVPNKFFLELKNSDKFQDALSEIFRFNYSFLNADATARAIGRNINSRMERAIDEHGNNAWSEAEAKLNLATSDKQDYSSENMEILLNLRDEYFPEYERRLYSKLQNSPIEEKALFVKEINSYKNRDFNINEIPITKNSDMLSILHAFYPIFKEDGIIAKNINEFYRKYYDILRTEFPKNIEELDNLLDDDYYKSLLWFNELDLIRDELLRDIDENNKVFSSDNQIGVKNNISADDIEIAEEENLESSDIDNESENNERNENSENDERSLHENTNLSNHDNDLNYDTLNTTTNNININHAEQAVRRHKRQNVITRYLGAKFVEFEKVKSKNIKNNSNDNGSVPKRMSTIARKAREKRARQAEEIVLETLKKLGYSEIQWISAYAKDKGVNPNGADGYGYDIQCKKGDEIRYIEVKSSLSST